jgi:hypothetical protein
MRAFIGLMALIAAGCSSQPTHPQANAAAAVPAASAAAPAANAGAPAATAAPGATATPAAAPAAAPGDIQAQRLAKAKNLNLKIYNKDGKEVFCRSNYVTASRIERDTRCFTAEELDRLEQQKQRQFDTLLTSPNLGSPGGPPGGIPSH